MTTAGTSPRVSGATALGVAAARAAETESDDPLISDPFARVFLDTAGDGEWDWYGAPDLPAEVVEAVPALPLRMKSMVSFFASRTKFFDTFFLNAANAGIRQVVILAAGLDARSWRLPWPDGVTVFELDQPRVLDFKASTLHEHGAEPTCHRVGVAVDLRQDWPKALQEAGFDASAPSAWSAEGLLMYLPATAQELLFSRIEALTAPGSRVGIEALSPNFADPAAAAQRRERLERVRAIMAKADPQRAVPRTDELWYFDEREDVGDWWRRHGWQVTVTPSDELMTGYGRTPPQDIDDGTPPYLFVSRTKVVNCAQLVGLLDGPSAARGACPQPGELFRDWLPGATIAGLFGLPGGAAPGPPGPGGQSRHGGGGSDGAASTRPTPHGNTDRPMPVAIAAAPTKRFTSIAGTSIRECLFVSDRLPRWRAAETIAVAATARDRPRQLPIDRSRVVSPSASSNSRPAPPDQCVTAENR